MKNNYLNIYNNLIKLTRNKNLYYNLKNNDTFSDRLVILLLHFSFFLKIYKNSLSKEEAQDLFDFIVRQIELSIREIGYGDVSVNKKMKDYVNLFYSILEKIENWDNFNSIEKKTIILSFLDLDNNIDSKIVDYFENYRNFLSKNSLNSLLKGVSKP